MSGFLLISTLIATTLAAQNISDALDEFDSGNYLQAATLLDNVGSAGTDADLPNDDLPNDLRYLRGRIAEDQGDWTRAEREFSQIGADSVLYDLAVWHLAGVALLDQRPEHAIEAIGWLPRDFPDDLLIQLASLAPPEIALGVYDAVGTRDARLESALIRDDKASLWSLLRERPNDDVAVRAARALFAESLDPDDRLFLADAYASHRSFDLAQALYRSLLEDPDLGPEAHFSLGRIYFQLTRYDDALGLYRATQLLYPESEWADMAEAQIPSTYWRKLDFESAAGAYRDLIATSRDSRQYQSSVRDLIDIYRALGDTESALEWVGLGLANRPSAADRAVLTFTRAKIEYVSGAYDAALASFRATRAMSLPAVPNGTDVEEVRFFEALSLARLERTEEARAIWRELAEAPFSYYGLKSAEKLGAQETFGHALSQLVRDTTSAIPDQTCRRPSEAMTRETSRVRRLSASREAVRTGLGTSRVGTLAFLNLWDEAFYWANQQAARYDNQTLADLAYLAGDYRRAILYADRLRPRRADELFSSESLADTDNLALLGMLYPAGFADYICTSADDAGTNPLWLRSIMWQESRYDPGARSGAVARGLMQFIPETALDVAAELGMGDLDVTRSLYDPAVSVSLGAHYWSYLMDEFPHPEMALAAYNGGPHNVRRWQAKSSSDEPEVFLADVGFVETKNYVRRIFELYARYAYLQEAFGPR